MWDGTGGGQGIGSAVTGSESASVSCFVMVYGYCCWHALRGDHFHLRPRWPMLVSLRCAVYHDAMYGVVDVVGACQLLITL